MKALLNITEYFAMAEKIEAKYGTIIEAKRVPKSDKLLQLTVDFGAEDIRPVVTNIGNRLAGLTSEADLVGRILPFVTNLEPAKIMGIESRAMILPPVHSNGVLEFGESLKGCNLL